MQEIPKLFTVVAEWEFMRGLRCRIEKQIFSWKNGRDPGGFFTRFLYAPDGDRHLVGRIVDSGDGADVSVYFWSVVRFGEKERM